ncbi:hypothetical protein DFQ26_003651 [Actinomortierella ambigua]|nr:hypothetical protein DFQ26_003651 [Actinomortierella ambigua]
MLPSILTRQPLRQACSRAFALAPRPPSAAALSSLPARCFSHSAFRRQTDQRDSANSTTSTTTTIPKDSSASQVDSSPYDDELNREPTEKEVTAAAYDFRAPAVWSMLRYLPQSLQYLICKSACERMLRNNTSQEYYPDQFLQGTGMAIHQMIPLLATNVDRTPLQSMMTQDLYNVFEQELERQERLGSNVSIRLAAVHDGQVKDVWVQLGPKLSSGTTKGFIRWRWQTLTVSLRAATSQVSSRDQVTQMMMEGVQFQVDVEFDATIEYRIQHPKLGLEMVTDMTRRPLLVRFETPYFQPAEEMVRSRRASRPDEAPIDWHWRVADIDYLLEQDFVDKRKREDVFEEEHAKREMGIDD